MPPPSDLSTLTEKPDRSTLHDLTEFKKPEHSAAALRPVNNLDMTLPKFLLFLMLSISVQAQDMITTASGLKYTITRPASGRTAQAGEYIQYHYIGKYEDGTVILNSYTMGEPAVYRMVTDSEAPLDGLSEALRLLHVGEKATLVLSPQLACGESDRRQLQVPPDATLRYEVEVLSIKSRSLYDVIWKEFEVGGIAAAQQKFSELQKDGFSDVYTGSGQLNYLGYGLMYRANRVAEAIEVFKWNSILHPTKGYVRDSLAEGYFIAGDRKNAQEQCRVALALDPTLESSMLMLDMLNASTLSPTRLEILQMKLKNGRLGFDQPPFKTTPLDFAYLQEQLDLFLTSARPEETAEKGKVVESYLALLQSAKTQPANTNAIWAKYAASQDQDVRDAVQRAREASEKAHLASEAAAKAKENSQNQ